MKLCGAKDGREKINLMYIEKAEIRMDFVLVRMVALRRQRVITWRNQQPSKVDLGKRLKRDLRQLMGSFKKGKGYVGAWEERIEG